MSPQSESTLKVPEGLRTELEEARKEYQSTEREYQRLLGLHYDLLPGQADGAVALRSAVRAMTRSTRRYSDALLAYNAFLLGKR